MVIGPDGHEVRNDPGARTPEQGPEEPSPMSTTNYSGQEGNATKQQLIANADSKVLKRSQYEAFSFSLEAPGMVRVTNDSHANSEEHSYVVDMQAHDGPVCECKAFQYGSGPCKHILATIIREPVLKAANQVLADGGQQKQKEKPYTTHTEPLDQGGKDYVKCEDCNRELLTELGGWDKLPHSEDCCHD